MENRSEQHKSSKKEIVQPVNQRTIPVAVAEKTPSQPAGSPAPSSISTYDKNRLRIGGGLNFIGDIGLLADGVSNKEPLTIVAGLLYTAGAGVAAIFGNVSKKRHLRDLRENTAEFLHNHATNKSEKLQSSQVLGERKTGFFADLDRGVRRYAGQTMLGFYLLGAITMLVNGIMGLKADRAAGNDLNEAKANIAYGIFSIGVKAASFCVPEKTAKEIEAETGAKKESGFIGWLTEKPMRIFGYGSLVTETMLAWRTYGKYQKRESGEDYRWSALTTGSYMLSDVVIADANKDSANAITLSDQECQNIEKMVAETIAHQPDEEQEMLTEKATEFLTKQSGFTRDKQEIKQILVNKASKIKSKMWEDRMEAMEEVAIAR